MSYSIKKIFSVLSPLAIVVAFAVFPIMARAEQNMEFNDVINVANPPGQYVVTTSLSTSEISSYSGLTLIGMIDQDDMDLPLGDIRNIMINQNSGNIPVSMILNYNPAGYAFQFCLVTSSTLAGQGGIYLFNPNNPNNPNIYPTYACSGISWYQPGQQGGGGDNITFSGTPSANITDSGGNDSLAATYSGSLNLEDMGSIGIDNVKVGIKFSDTTIPTTYSGPFDEEFFGNQDPSLNDLPGGAFGGIYNYGQGFTAGQTYYVLFKVMPSNANANFTGDSELVEIIAPGGDTNPGGNPGGQTPGGSQPGTDPNPIIFSSTIVNPLGQDMDIIDFLQKLFVNIVKIAFPFLVIFMIWSGFMFVEARGNEEKLKKAKKNFFYVIIGALLVLGAWTIASVIKGTVDELEAPLVYIKLINNLV